MRYVLLAIVILMTLGARPDPSPDAAFLERARELADRAVSDLTAANTGSVAAKLHYPPDYTAHQRADDTASVDKMLQFLLARFGDLRDPRKSSVAVTFYELTASGGSIGYWNSVSPFRTSDFVYSTRFSRAGDGYVVVRVLSQPKTSTIEIQRIGFGIPTASPQARSTVIRWTREIMQLMRVPTPPNFEQILEQTTRPVSVQPVVD